MWEKSYTVEVLEFSGDRAGIFFFFFFLVSAKNVYEKMTYVAREDLKATWNGVSGFPLVGSAENSC